MSSLTQDQELRHGRNMLLPEIGLQGQERLRGASVLLEGLGATGSAAALYLAVAGVGHLELCDEAPVEPADLAGTLYVAGDIGLPRAERARRALAEIDGTLAMDAAVRPELSLRAVDGCAGPLVDARGHTVVVCSAAGGPEALAAGALGAAEVVKKLLGIGAPLRLEALP